MGYFQAIFLGILQGLTEFLPVSSSGHLVLAQHFFKLKESMVFFDVMLHLGTLLAVLVFFRNDLIRIVSGIIGRDSDDAEGWIGTTGEARRYALWIFIGCIPAGLAGVALNDVFEGLFSNPRAVSVALLITGGILFIASRVRTVEGRTAGTMRLKDVLVVGFAQALAITPGISRSGSTISAGLLMGLDRTEAARFSFLLFIPVMLGATAMQLRKVSGIHEIGQTVIGAACAFVVGLVALKLVFNLLRKGKLVWFAVYCWVIGVVSFIALSLGA